MNHSQTIIAVIQQFRTIFADKGALKGYDDWDAFFGCINALETVAAQLQEEEQKPEEEPE